VLERIRPGAELLAVVAHDAQPRPIVRGVRLQVCDDVVDVAERDSVAQPLLRPEDRQQRALVLGHVRAPQGLFGHRCRPEVGVVQDRPAIPGAGDGHRQVRLPDALGEPGPGRTDANEPLDLVGHAPQLAHTIAIRQRDEHRLRPAAAHHLHLAPRDEGTQPDHEVRPFGADPLEERPRDVERDADAGMPL
jgi:hypothetical protein